MKFLKKLLFALVPLMVAGSLASCTKDNASDNKGGGEDGKDLTLQLEVANADLQSLEIKCTPSNAAATYMVLAIEADADKSDETLIAERLSALEFEARLQGEKMEEYVASVQKTGTQNVIFDGLKDDTAYNIYAYANDSKGAVKGAICKIEARTAAKEALSLAISVSDVADMNATITITPNDKEATYFYDYVKKSDYDAWGGDEKTIAQNVEYMDQAIAYLAMAGYNITYSYWLDNGDMSGKVENLVPETDYVVFAFGMNEDGTITSGLSRADFKTKSFIATDNCSFTLSTTDVTATSMTVNVAPSAEATRYIVGITPASETAKYTLDEIAAGFIEEIENINDNNKLTWETTPFVFSGAKSLASKDDLGYDTFTGGREYLVMVFGIDNNGKRTTVPTTLLQRTAQVEQSNMTFDINIHSISINGAKAQFTPTSKTETYFTDIMTKEEYDSYGSDQAVIDYIVNTLGSNISAYLTSGDHEVDATNYLVSDTKYVAYCFGYNNGATTKVFSKEFTTDHLESGSDAAVAFEAVVEDGDIYAELYPDYVGKAVVSLLMTPNKSASKWYCALTTDERVLSMSESDLTQWASMSSYTNRKQMIYIGEWNTTLYVVVVAFDGKGVAGKPALHTVAITKANAGTQSAKPTLSSVERFVRPAAKAPAKYAPMQTALRNADKRTVTTPAQRLADKFKK